MSRYYRIVVSDPSTGAVIIPNLNGTPGFGRQAANPTLSTYTSLNAGASPFTLGGTNPNAQQIEINAPLVIAHTPGGNSLPFIKIWGVGLAEISQAANLQGLNVAVYGGMARGLPLANPQQSGVLFTGTIFQSYGIWNGTEMSLAIYANQTASQTANQTTATPPTYTSVPVAIANSRVPNPSQPGSLSAGPANFVFQWVQGQNILDAIQATLQTVFPQYEISANVSPNLVLTGAAVTAYFRTFQQFAQFIHEKSLSLLAGYAPSGSYLGVMMVAYQNSIYISDGTTQTTPKQIQYLDLQGQPTWGLPSEVSVQCTMRADINPLDYVTLPAGPGTTTATAQSQFYNVGAGNTFSTAKDGSIFSGTFLVRSVWHLGNSRGRQGTDWITSLDLLLQSVSPAQQQQNELTILQKASNRFGFFVPQ
jgi:hypothetical protein